MKTPIGLMGSSSRAREVEIRWLMISRACNCRSRAGPGMSAAKDGGDFVLHHFADGNSGPGRDDFADDLRIDCDANHWLFALQRCEFGLSLGKLAAHGGYVHRLGSFLDRGGRGRC